jgi:uncharacterized damage-inducible protein DinB
MRLNDLLIAEFDEEVKKTRATLERVPAGKGEFKPHAKSMPMGRLAAHLAQLAGFGATILTEPGLDFSKSPRMAPVVFESAGQLVGVFDEGAANVRRALGQVSDQAWFNPWPLSMGDQVVFKGTRFMAYRQLFVNHLVHHRAQLGVYFRLNDVPVPAAYGPSADEPVGS